MFKEDHKNVLSGIKGLVTILTDQDGEHIILYMNIYLKS